MLSKFAKALLIATSYAPVLLTFAFADYIENGFKNSHITFIAIVIGLVILCHLVLTEAKRRLELLKFKITSVKTADMEIVGFVIAYLLPFVNSSSVHVNYAVLIFILILLLVITWTTNSYHFNPLLAFFGYHFYEVTTEGAITFLLITKKDVRKTSEIKSVVQLTNYITLDAGE